MNDNTLNEFRQLVDDVMNAPTKKDALYPLKRLKFKASELNGVIDPYLFGKLGEVIDFADEASGKVSNKQHWINCVEKHWYDFYNGVKHGENRAADPPTLILKTPKL